MRWSAKLAACIALGGVCLSAGCMTADELQPFDASRVTLLQMEPLLEGEDIAVFTTDDGEFRMRFFPSEAPQAVENFLLLAREGKLDNTPLSAESLANGAPQVAVGGEAISLVDDGKPFPVEISANLWHFSGAVSVVENKRGKGDGRFFIVGSTPVDEALLSDLAEQNYPESVIEAFRLHGGIPAYSLEYSVFGQIVEGQEIVDRLLTRMAEGDETVILRSVAIEIYSAPE